MNKKTSSQVLLRTLAAPLMMAIPLFIPAGRLDYWQGWVYVGLNMLIVLATWLTLRNKPQLVEERLKPGAGMKTWDKWYFALSTPLYFVMLIVAGLDAGRFGWTGALPRSIYVLSFAMYLLGQGIFLWAKWVNSFFATVVRIQTDRGQTVCQEGPYRLVRHPGYVGGILFGLSAPLMLGSWWALIPAAIAALMLVVRTYLEDETLQDELAGYAEYTRLVRYRLLPGVW